MWSALPALVPLLEWLQQMLLPTRQFSELDIAAYLLGELLAWLGCYSLPALRQHLLPSQ